MRVRRGISGLIVADEGHLNGLLVADGSGRALRGLRGYGDTASTVSTGGSLLAPLLALAGGALAYKKGYKKTAYLFGAWAALTLMSGSSATPAAASTTTEVAPVPQPDGTSAPSGT